MCAELARKPSLDASSSRSDIISLIKILFFDSAVGNCKRSILSRREKRGMSSSSTTNSFRFQDLKNGSSQGHNLAVTVLCVPNWVETCNLSILSRREKRWMSSSSTTNSFSVAWNASWSDRLRVGWLNGCSFITSTGA